MMTEQRVGKLRIQTITEKTNKQYQLFAAYEYKVLVLYRND